MVKDDIASAVLAAVGGKDNVLTNTVCMTRLRVTLKNPQEVDYTVLNEVPSVLGTATRGVNGLEVVFGPRMIDSIYHAFTRLTGIRSNQEALFPMFRQNSNLSVSITTNTGTVSSKEAPETAPVTPSAAEPAAPKEPEVATPDAEDLTADEEDVAYDAEPVSTLIIPTDEDEDEDEEEEEDQDSAASDVLILEDILEDMESPKPASEKPRKAPTKTYSLLVLNGPNLNLLGLTDNGVEEGLDFAALLELCKQSAQEAGFDRCVTFQSNHEGDLVDQIQDAYCVYDAILINPGPLSSARSIGQALDLVRIPYKEVYLNASAYDAEDFGLYRNAIFSLAKAVLP